jgi:hypothetical protein
MANTSSYLESLEALASSETFTGLVLGAGSHDSFTRGLSIGEEFTTEFSGDISVAQVVEHAQSVFEAEGIQGPSDEDELVLGAAIAAFKIKRELRA